MSRTYLAIGAALVAAAVILLYVLLRADGPPPPAPVAPASGPKTADPEPGKPRLPPVTRAAPAPPDAAEIDYTIGDKRIHDHRAGEHAPVEPPPPRSPPQGDRQIAAPVTAALSQKLRPSLQECAANLAPEAHGARSRVEGEIIIAIRDHQATITSATFQLRDFADAGQDELKQCLVQHAVGVAAPAGDEADVAAYAITVSLRWP